ncbi:RNA-binding domain-containing protein [Coccomyxa subellipsoidea C-169]|uniref:RNA-binding domain-containing protein n=1 Tax=Coccomyxa subellipsoidea (strain C-169) TaxID=574566 RepID=I0Z9U8_COCSC|nr:RNA-binding domain-containing protein [Coccomyxa subellipsoidea C-169]EIE27417.1 RNA-binding domain-containing protein [Coccomyxa subellipsoidea C-169]|eukprot:XP_005651961.1 RNA-binding domain-containing protein [Coccomyxa subellipsoidea C-169]
MPETETQITDQKRKISGPGNAEEAQMLREKLGLSHASPAAGVSSKQPFKFGFSPTERDDDAPQIEDTNGAERSTESGEETKTTEADAALQERLKRVMGEPSGSTERRVFVGGMPFGYEESDVLDYWSYCGEIESLDLMRFPDTGRFKGIAFITFKTEGGYKAALECDGMTIDTVQIKVEPCISAGPKRKKQRNEVVSQTNRKAHSGAAPKVEGYNVAYVGNIAFEAGESDLRELLAGCEITKVRRHTDKDTGKFKGYAHVHFADEESLDRAMEFDGAALKGRRIRVGYAQEKKPKE